MWQRSKNAYHKSTALLSHIRHGFPARKLKVIGVTGTSGKTTTTVMIYEMLKNAGYKVSVISTIKAVIGGKEYDTGFHVTTPSPYALPKFLKQAVDNGDEYFVMEVSSHALDQNRTAFVHFDIGVLTTLAHEHLDYHKTLENYARAKFKLLHMADRVVMPLEGIPSKIKHAVRFDQLSGKVVTFGLTKANVNQKKLQLAIKMPGTFNLLNGLAAVAVGEIVGIPENVIKVGLESVKSLPGRFEEVPNKKGMRIVIDFAHKPDALEGILKTARELVSGKGRVIVLYGCASERDTLKRPMMGEISGRLADITVLTDEDPRYEDSMKIIDEIAVGCIKGGALDATNDYKESAKHIFLKIPDRSSAIQYIITKIAKRGDIVLLCGKGHEQSMNYRGVEKPWSEHEAVRQALEL